MQKLLIIASVAAVIIAAAPGIIEASNRRADYLEAEAEYYSCIESGLSRAECAAAVGW